MGSRTIVIAAWIFTGGTFAQDITLLHDSLEERLRLERNDTARVDLHDQLAMIYIDQLDDSLAMDHLRQGTELARRLHYPTGLAYSALIEGIEQYRARQYAEALVLFQECIDRLDEAGVVEGLLSPLGFIRQVYNDAGLQEEKQDFYLAKLAYYERQGPRENLGVCHHGLGGYYYLTGQGDKAIEHYLRAREIFADFDPVGYANQLWPIGAIYLSWGNLQKAEIYHRQAIQENLKVGLLSNVVASYNAMAIVLLQKGDTLGALKELNESRRFWRRCPPRLLAPRILSVVSIHLGQHDLDSAGHYLAMADSLARVAPLPLSSVKGEIELEHHHYLYLRAMGNDAGADEALERALADALQQNVVRHIQKYRKELAERYRIRGKPLAALDMMMAYTQVSDSLQADRDRRKVADYERELKEQQSALEFQQQQTRFEKQRLLMIGTIAFAALLVLLVFVVLRNNRLKQRTNRALDLARQHAEASEKSKQQFLANMSHEIRTPMNAIMGMSGILKRNEHTPEQEKYLNAISQSSENLLVILNDILDLSKLEAGRIDVEKVPFDPRKVVGNVRDILRFKAEEKGIALELSIDDGVPGSLLGDPTRLNQIVLNLAGNAVKFTERGSVTIDVRCSVDPPGRPGGVALIIDVIDTGIGIPADRLEKVFEEFTQAYSDTTRKYGGTGLGLSISKRLAEMQGGTIAVTSEQGVGSTFTVTIPYEIPGSSGEKDPVRTDDHRSSQIALRDLRILLAEDNDFNAIVAQDELADAIPGVHVAVAPNGRIAVEMASANDYDVILMDVQMPEMNGYDATRAIRSLPGPKSRMPIIAMTANVMKEEVERCTDAGMDGFVPKPFTREQLVEAIRNVMRA